MTSADSDSTGESCEDPMPDDVARVLTPDGEVADGATVPDLDDAELLGLYREMAFARRFDERAVSLQRQGRLGTYPPVSGQEATQIATARALDDGDWVFPTYRESAVALARGVPPEAVLHYWMGHETGNVALADANVFPFNIVIGSLVPHAVGMGMAEQYTQPDDPQAMVCYFGDGATSEGDFHEGLNFAGVFDAPTVFVCSNNQYAISVGRDEQTASATIAQKADAYGFEGVRVDGMDPLAVYRVTRDALSKAKHPGEGEARPTLVEAVQYRFGAHTTADDPSVYRDDDELAAWKNLDPVPRLRAFLRSTGRVDDERLSAIHDEIDDELADAIDRAESESPGDPEEMFESTYETPTPEVQRQLDWFRSLRERHGDTALTDTH